MAGQIATIILHVDLSCPKCYNKIRQVLCKFNCQIQSKVFDEENNIVIITGFFYPCCKFARKLCRRAGKVIKKIDIKQNENTESEEPKPEPSAVDNPPPVPPAPEPEPAPAPAPEPEPAPAPAPAPEPEPAPAPAAPTEEPEPQPQPKIKVPYPVPGYPPPQEPQFGDVYCGPSYEGYGEGPCYQGYGMPTVPPPPYYDYYGRRPPPPCSCGCGGYRRCSTPCEYINEEDPSACSIM